MSKSLDSPKITPVSSSSTNATIVPPPTISVSASRTWQTAIAQLDPKLLHCLNLVKGDALDVLGQVLENAQEKKRLSLEGRWSIRIQGRKVILRDVFDKIIGWLQNFIVVGDVAVQFNAEAASLPWAAFRFVLQAAVNEKQRFESTIMGLETVTWLMTRYAVVEKYYLNSGPDVLVELQERLVGLYVCILEFLAQSVRYFAQSAGVRALKSVFQAGQDGQLQKMNVLDQALQPLCRLYDTQVQHQMRKDVARVLDASKVYAKELEEREYADFHKWLSSIPYKENHRRHSENRIPGSAKWILQHPKYMDWKTNSSSSILLLSGIAGSGKTIITSAVIDSLLEEQLQNLPGIPTLYLYCGDSELGSRTATAGEIMRSLTRQLAIVDKDKRKIHEQIWLEYQRRSAEAKLNVDDMLPLDCGNCTDLMLEIFATNPAVVVLDAIDEMEEDSRSELLHALINIREHASSAVKIFLSSRHDTKTNKILHKEIKVQVDVQQTRVDMEAFVHHSVSIAMKEWELIDLKVGSILQADLKAFLLERCGEMFLWVKVHVQYLRCLMSEKAITDAIYTDRIASTQSIYDIYSNTLRKLSASDRGIAMRALSWLMCMHVALDADAFLVAISSNGSDVSGAITRGSLLTMCSNLIVWDHTLNRFRYAHVSVRDFLKSLPEFNCATVNRLATEHCISTCMQNLPLELDPILHPEKDFSVYAAMYCLVHYTASRTEDTQSNSVYDCLEEFVFSGEEVSFAFQMWVETVDEISKHLPGEHDMVKRLNALKSPDTATDETPLFTACTFGIEEIIRRLSRAANFDVDAKNALGHTGLYLAAFYDCQETVHQLIRLGARVDAHGGHYGNAINAACARGHATVVRLLLSDTHYPMSIDQLKTALTLSLQTGREEISHMLINTDGMVNTQDDYDQILATVSQLGFLDIMQHLQRTLPSFQNINSFPPSTKIERLMKHTGFEAFKRYLTKINLSEDAVALAAFHGRKEIVSLLLDKNFDLETEGLFGTPLRTASLMGHEPTVRLLLQRGAEVSEKGLFGDALQAAAMNGHLAVTATLIQHRANVNNSSGYYGNALQAAVIRGHIAIAEALIAAGAQMKYGGLYTDAFCAAAASGQESMISLLVRQGYEIPQGYPQREKCKMSTPPRHRNLLSKAYRTSQRGIRKSVPVSSFVQVFDIARGAKQEHPQELTPSDDSITSSRGRDRPISALEVAASCGNAFGVKHLLELGDRICLSKINMAWSLQAALEKGHPKVARLILSEPDIPDLQPALERAAWYGHVAIVEQLLARTEVLKSPPTNTPYNPERESSRAEGWRDSLAESGKSHWTDFCRKITHYSRSRHRGSLPRHAASVATVEPDTIPRFFSEIAETETTKDRHILRILVLGCRGNQPSTVAYALHLAESSALRHLEGLAVVEAARCGSDRVLDELYRKFPSIDSVFLDYAWKEAGAQFVAAASMGKMGFLQFSLDRVKNGDDHGPILAQALDQACEYGHTSIITFLLECGAEINALAEALKPTIYVSNDCLSRRSLNQGPAARWPRSPLQASLQAIPEYSRYQGMTISDYNGPGELPGFKKRKAAIVLRQEKVVALLLQHGAHVDVVDHLGRTPLHTAVLNASLHTVQMLLHYGADTQAYGQYEGTPPRCAGWREVDSLPIVHALIDAGAPMPVLVHGNRYSNPILDAAIDIFGPVPQDRLRMRRSHDVSSSFVESESIEQVLSTGPGAVVKFLLESEPRLHADHRFNPLLEMVACQGDADFMQLLMERGVDVDGKGHFYGCALQAAAAGGHQRCVELLLEAGADVNIVGGHDYRLKGCTPLSLAVERRHVGIVKAIVRGALDLLSHDYSSTLKSAVESSRTEIVLLLLSKAGEFDPAKSEKENVRKVYGNLSSALRSACRLGNLDLVKILIRHGADVGSHRVSGNTSVNSALEEAMVLDRIPIVQLLVDSGATLYDAHRGMNVLIAADKSRYQGLSQAVVEYTVEKLLCTEQFIPLCKDYPLFMRHWKESIAVFFRLDEMPKTPELYHHACILGARHTVASILDKGMDVNIDFTDGGRALQVAARFQRFRLIEELLSRGADPQYACPMFGSTVYAALEGLILFEQTYLQRSEIPEKAEYRCRKIDVTTLKSRPGIHIEGVFKGIIDLVHATGFTHEVDVRPFGNPMHLAAYLGSLDLVKLFMRVGTDTNSTGGVFGTALIAALHGGHLSIVSFLLDHGSIVDCSSAQLGTPLQVACDKDSTEMVRLLLTHGIKVDTSYVGLDPPLQVACRHKNSELAQMLLSHGANVNVYTEGYGTPLHIACRTGNMEMVQLLLRHGVEVNTSHVGLEPPLQVACQHKNSELAQILLSNGANVNLYAEGYGTPLYIACHTGNMGMVQLLLRHGADVNAPGKGQHSSLAALLHSKEHTVTVEDLVILSMHSTELHVRDEDLKQAVILENMPQERFSSSTREAPSDRGVLKFLLQYDSNLEVTSDLILEALPPLQTASLLDFRAHLAPHSLHCEPRPSSILRILLDRAPNVEITPKMLMCARHQDDMRLLVRHPRRCDLTPELLEHVSARRDVKLIKVITEEVPTLRPTMKTITVLLQSSNMSGVQPRFTLDSRQSNRFGDLGVIQSVFEHHPDFPVTSSMLSETKSTKALKLLLSRVPPHTIDEATLLACMTQSPNPKNLERLLQHNRNLRVSPELLSACNRKAYDVGSYIQILLEHDPNLQLPEDIMISCLESGVRTLKLLEKVGKKLDLTPRVHEVISQILNAQPRSESRDAICKLVKDDEKYILREILGSPST